MVRETGLEPVWMNHTPLKRARLPVPPLSHIFLKVFQPCSTIILKLRQLVKTFFRFLQNYFAQNENKTCGEVKMRHFPAYFTVNYIRRNSLLRFLPSFILPEISKGEIYDDCRYCANAHERGKNYCEQLRHSQFNFFLLSLLSHFISLLFSFVSMIYPYQASEPPLREF